MTVALAYAQELLTCLENALVSRNGPITPVPANICLRAGGEVAPQLSRIANECCEGLAWVRIVQVDPKSGPDDNTGKCVGSLRRATLEMGVVRCAPTPDADSMITCEQWTTMALRQESDHSAMEEALCCLVGLGPDQLGDPDIYPGTYTPFGPDADCIGGIMQLTIEHGCSCGSGA